MNAEFPQGPSSSNSQNLELVSQFEIYNRLAEDFHRNKNPRKHPGAMVHNFSEKDLRTIVSVDYIKYRQSQTPTKQATGWFQRTLSKSKEEGKTDIKKVE